jgi:competence protein ComEA
VPDHPDPRPPADPLADLRLDPPTWRERGEELLGLGPSPSPGRLVLAVLVAVGVVGVGAWYAVIGGRPAGPVENTLPTASVAPAPAAADGARAPTTDTTVGRGVVAHAAGAVHAPGVYELAPGARVADLIEAAGGLRPDADADRLNLALVVADGSRLFVPVVGQQPPDELGVAGGARPPAEGGVDGADEGGAAGAGAPVDLNTADVALLDTLPGVGPATAQAIVDHRREHGRFERVDELIDVRGIGEAKLAQLRDLVRV